MKTITAITKLVEIISMATTSKPARRRATVLSIREAEESDAERLCEIVTCCIRDVYARYYASTHCSELSAVQTLQNYTQMVEEGNVVVAEGVLASDSDDLSGDTFGENIVLGFGQLSLISNSEGGSPFPSGYHVKVKKLYVDPAAHRRGVGKRLMKEMERIALSVGCDRLGVLSSLYAVSFYQSLGFRDIGEYLYPIGFAGTHMKTRVMVKDDLLPVLIKHE